MSTDIKPPVTRDSDKFMLRLPDGMRDRIAAEAKLNNRSMNAEIISRLDDSLSDVGQAQSPNLSFLLARMEMRAAEAELDKIELCAMLNEAIWSLKTAVLCIPSDQLSSDAEIIETVAQWNETIADGERYVTEHSETGLDALEATRRKADELTSATKKAKAAFENAINARNEMMHKVTQPRIARAPRTKKP
jgi:hypothetical protein